MQIKLLHRIHRMRDSLACRERVVLLFSNRRRKGQAPYRDFSVEMTERKLSYTKNRFIRGTKPHSRPLASETSFVWATASRLPPCIRSFRDASPNEVTQYYKKTVARLHHPNPVRSTITGSLAWGAHYL